MAKSSREYGIFDHKDETLSSDKFDRFVHVVRVDENEEVRPDARPY